MIYYTCDLTFDTTEAAKQRLPHGVLWYGIDLPNGDRHGAYRPEWLEETAAQVAYAIAHALMVSSRKLMAPERPVEVRNQTRLDDHDNTRRLFVVRWIPVALLPRHFRPMSEHERRRLLLHWIVARKRFEVERRHRIADARAMAEHWT